jgi:hypothetical protein
MFRVLHPILARRGAPSWCKPLDCAESGSRLPFARVISTYFSTTSVKIAFAAMVM